MTEELPPRLLALLKKSNILLIGPTGSGKTLCRSFLSSCVAFSRASFESLVFLILASISANSSRLCR